MKRSLQSNNQVSTIVMIMVKITNMASLKARVMAKANVTMKVPKVTLMHTWRNEK